MAMAAAKYIGRVGRLAVALGVGAAIATGHGVASAETSGNSGDGPSTSSSASTNSTSSTSTTDTSAATSASDNAAEPTVDDDLAGPETTDEPEPELGEPDADGDDVDEEVEANTGEAVEEETEDGTDDALVEEDASPEDKGDQPAEQPVTTGTENDPPAAEPSATSAAVADRTSASRTVDAAADDELSAPSGTGDSVMGLTAYTAGSSDDETLTDTDGLAASTTAVAAAPPVSAQGPVGALLAIPGTFLQVASNLIAAALTPFLAPAGPAAPAQPPALWAVLAWVRREIQHTFFNTRPAVAYVAAANKQDADGIVTGDLDITDREGDPVKVAVVDGPRDGTVEVAADGTFRYEPSAALAAAGGTDTFVVRVSDSGSHLHGLWGLFQSGGGHATTRTIEVTVAAVNAPPDDPQIVDVITDPDGTVTGRVTVDDPNADDIIYSGPTTSDNGGTVAVAEDGTFVYTPTAEIRHAAAAIDEPVTTDSFTVTADDGRGGVTTVAVTVSVVAQNNAPTADVTITPVGDGSSLITIFVDDEDGDSVRLVFDAPERGSIEGLPADGVIVVDGHAGSTIELRYVPNSGAEPGTDTVTFAVDDGYLDGQFPATATVTIDAPNSAPVITGVATDGVDTTTGAISGTVTATDDAGVAAYAVSTAAHGEVSIDDDGRFVYTPDLTYFGGKPAGTIDSFVVTVTDTDGATVTRTLTYTWAPTIAGLEANDDQQRLSERLVFGWAVSSDGTTLYLNDGNPRIAVPQGIVQDIRVFRIGVDMAGNKTYTELDPITVSGYLAKGPIAVSADGTKLYVQEVQEADQIFGDQPVSVRTIDLATKRYDQSPAASHGGKFSDMTVTPDGTRLYGTDLSGRLTVIDLTTGEATTIADTGMSLYVAVSSDGSTLYRLRLGDGLVATDLVTQQSRIVSAGFADTQAIGVSPDGTRVYLVRSSEAELSVVDTASGAVLQTIPVPDGDERLLVTSDGTVYVVSAAAGTVQTFSPVLGPGGTITA
jgi:VCBS repeat-containing protein